MSQKSTILACVALFAFGVFFAPSATFAAATVQSVKMTSSNTITIIFSQPVYTSATDYSNFTDSFNGLGVTSVLGSGTNNIVLVLNGTVSTTGTGSLNIGSNIKGVSDNQYITGGTWTIVPLVVVPPSLTTFSMLSSVSDGTFAGTGDVITVTFAFNKAVNIQTFTLAGHQLYPNGSGSGPYSTTYTMQSSDAQQSVPVSITMTDTYGSQSRINLSYSSNNTGTSGTSMIGAITSNANTSGVLGIGDSITFTLTPTIVQPNARVYGYYNGSPLTWTTSNGGANYTATYTVAYGQASQTYPVQISGVTLTDQYGNVSAPAAGYDVQKTINALTQSQGPMLSQITAVPATVTTATPLYTFYSSAAGTITYGGACTSQTTSAVVGLNTIMFSPLSNGTYGNCTIGVIGNSGTLGNTLAIPTFTVTGVGTTNTTNTSNVDALAAQLQALKDQLAKAQSGNTTTDSTYKFYNPLKVGSKGTEVSELQKRLTSEGVYSGPITGTYGSQTEAAVKKYQKLHGLTQLGNVGPGTRAALNGE